MITRADRSNDIRPGSLDHREAQGPRYEPHVSPSQLARYWGVHVHTIYRDIAKGAVRSFRLPGGQLRIRMSDARRYGRPNR